MDVAVDQGGCFETTKPTTHSDPVYVVDGVLHYCVANIPGIVPRTSTAALTNATLPYLLRLASQGVEVAVRADAGLAKGVNLSGGSSLMRAALAQTFATAGRKKEAIQILDDLTELTKQKYVAPYFFAGIHVGLGEDDRAIEYLEKSYEEHSHWLIYLHLDPSMDGLRSNPRFQDLLHRVGLPLRHAIPT